MWKKGNAVRRKKDQPNVQFISHRFLNAANKNLCMGSGVCGAIYLEAGIGQLQAACKKIGQIDTGEAVMTDGFNLPAKYIIHTAGPVYQGGGNNEKELLIACYKNSL